MSISTAAKIRKDLQAKKEKFICYVRLLPENAAWIYEQTAKTNHSISHVINKLVESERLGKKFELDEKIPSYILKAEQAKERRLQRLRVLNKAAITPGKKPRGRPRKEPAETLAV